ncbi:simple sugar transport system permease protein [Clostridium saccharoperbutylacetonicum]|uniref:Nucleoside ABC transporter membrane protein n=3 Tax=Clostridium saccharoperbutylacetonicum TaxID=36745 RepID=M1MKG4_9CLOT|nr:ABC transporter permease [Clostridium saccharoperbutylacetonicum]AGF58429.1 nucleoside ABC transporter membrane protein [Clostridium saccharoperbutylacetonicum N1-4(HMT)]NRT60793.1 simple sugar transport system permease protein [Clostridium saccharoperbutylacetonicum]NSB24107.1 simple sugar transport system permease protein [Clostridium saccharoperbutylacetonicum]NSB43485.1 simple sugar transport system permease protein [Clostridium saccharoperbutylacetonicum]
MSKKEALNSILAVVLGLIAGAILMFIIGDNPAEGYAYLYKGALINFKRFGDTLATATPLILTGLSVGFAFKTGLFNIGTPGQMLFGGFCATVIGLTYGAVLPRVILLLVMIVAGAIAGALWAFVPGVLKAKFNVNEVVSAIMMNWICYWIVYYAIPAYFKGSTETESKSIVEAASLKTKWLTDLFSGSYINLGIFIAVIAVIVIAFILNKTVLGYELKAVGFNKSAAEYAGMSVNRNIVVSMMIAGALSGLAGVAQYVGNASNMQIGVMPSQGFDGIAVSLLGANNPVGILISALFFGVLYSGKGFMNANTNIPPEIADTIIATIIYFAAISAAVPMIVNAIKHRKAMAQAKVAENNAVSSNTKPEENHDENKEENKELEKDNIESGQNNIEEPKETEDIDNKEEK